MYAGEVPAYGTLVEVSGEVNADYVARHPRRRTPRLAAAGHRRAARRHPGRQPGRAGRRRRPVRRVRHAAGGLLRSCARAASRDSGGVDRFSAHRSRRAGAQSVSGVHVDAGHPRPPILRRGPAYPRGERSSRTANCSTPPCSPRRGSIAAEGCCDADEAQAFVAAAVAAFALSREPIDKSWYDELSRVSAVAADIAGVSSTHINHLTPRVLDIDDLYRRMTRRGITMIDAIQGPPRTDGPAGAVAPDLFSRSRRTVPVPRQGRHRLAPGQLRVRFGEVEARGVALTPPGRQRYDAAMARSPKPARVWSRYFPSTDAEMAAARAGLLPRRRPVGAHRLRRLPAGFGGGHLPLQPGPRHEAPPNVADDSGYDATVGWPGPSAATFMTRTRCTKRFPRRHPSEHADGATSCARARCARPWPAIGA